MAPKRRKAAPAAEMVLVDELTPWDKNPRDNSEAIEQVAQSIKRFGFAAPIVAQRSGRIIAGHTRWAAARSMGLEEVPVRYVDLDDSEAAALALADNKLQEVADWREDLLGEVLAELEQDGVDLDGLGWSSEELDELISGLEPEEPEPEEPEPEEPPADPESRQGEVYQLGPHRLICGDCRDPEVVARLLDGAQVNVAFTSPPYASQRKYDESSGFKPIAPDDYVDWFDAVQSNVRDVLAADGSWFVNIKAHCQDGQRHLYVHDLTLAHVRSWGWRLVDDLIWHKPGMPGLYGERFKNEHEPIYHFAGAAKCRTRFDAVTHASETVPTASVGTNAAMQGRGDPLRGRGKGFALPGNVIRATADTVNVGTHAARFPVALPSFFVRAFSDEGDAIFDPFMGSGTTLIAAAKHDRVAYGCEISPAYCDVIRRRWTAWATDRGVDPGEGAL